MRKELLPAPLRGLKARRVKKGMTQEGLSKVSGLSKQAVCEIERGNQRPSRPTLIILCDALSLPTADRQAMFRFFEHKPESDIDRLSMHIRKLRLDAGFSQIDMAKAIGATRASIGRAEAGKLAARRISTLVYDYFNVPQDERYEDNEYQAPSDFIDAVPTGE